MKYIEQYRTSENRIEWNRVEQNGTKQNIRESNKIEQNISVQSRIKHIAAQHHTE